MGTESPREVVDAAISYAISEMPNFQMGCLPSDFPMTARISFESYLAALNSFRGVTSAGEETPYLRTFM